MEEKFKILEAPIGFDLQNNNVHVAVPIQKPVSIKGKWRVINETFLVTSNCEFWSLNSEEQEKRKTYFSSIPQFPLRKEYWRKEDIERFLKTGQDNKIEPYFEVFEPIKEILDQTIDFKNPTDSTLIAIWIMGTYLLPVFDAYPYILLTGTRGSGKTKVLDIASRLAFNAELTSNATPSSIFRIIESNQSTILIDEGEMLSSREDSQELRLILNAGYKRNNPVSRTNKETHEVQWFNVFSPKMIAAINTLDQTLRSRCLQITMIRTANKEKGNKRINDNTICWSSFKDSLYRYALQCMPEVKEIFEKDEEINILQCRQNELWSPLLAVAKHLNLYQQATVFDELRKRALEEDLEDDSLDDWHKAVLQSLSDIVELKRDYSIKEIRERLSFYIEDTEELQKMSSRWVGSALGRFGFKKGKRQEQGNTYLISKEEVGDLLIRYEIKKEVEDTEHTVEERSEIA